MTVGGMGVSGYQGYGVEQGKNNKLQAEQQNQQVANQKSAIQAKDDQKSMQMQQQGRQQTAQMLGIGVNLNVMA
ncbi:MAG: hypothetical protein HXX81_07275 [Campylobacterales bacterium]|nr:hypothetical protein [Campylobacterales bacterium]